MIRMIPGLVMTALLAACGVDGVPSHPDPTPQAGLTVTGTAEIGVTGGS